MLANASCNRFSSFPEDWLHKQTRTRTWPCAGSSVLIHFCFLLAAHSYIIEWLTCFTDNFFKNHIKHLILETWQPRSGNCCGCIMYFVTKVLVLWDTLRFLRDRKKNKIFQWLKQASFCHLTDTPLECMVITENFVDICHIPVPDEKAVRYEGSWFFRTENQNFTMVPMTIFTSPKMHQWWCQPAFSIRSFNHIHQVMPTTQKWKTHTEIRARPIISTVCGLML